MSKIKIAVHQPDEMIRFLEKEDSRLSRELTREAIWHYLKRVHLTEAQKKRLRAIAIRCLQQQMRREFWKMCKLMYYIADDPFRAEVKRYTTWSDEKVKKRASLMDAYLQSLEAGARARREFRTECLREKWRPGSKASIELSKTLSC